MIVAVCILAYFVVTLTAALIWACYASGFHKDEWFAITIFALCPPLWLVILKVGRAIIRRREKKRREEAKKRIEEARRSEK